MYPLFNFTMCCLYVAEVIFVAYIGIMKGPGQGVAALVLIGVTVLWHWMVSDMLL